MDDANTIYLHDELHISRNSLCAIKKIDDQLAYLVLLTLAGLKPLSRWERALQTGQIELLSSVGLNVVQIQRFR